MYGIIETSKRVYNKNSIRPGRYLVVWFCIILFFISSVFIGGAFFYLRQETKHIRDRLFLHQSIILELDPSILSDLMDEIEQTVLMMAQYLKSRHDLMNFNGGKTDVNFEVENFLKYLSELSGKYDQIRFLDNNGQEQIRINNYDGTPVIVPETELQNKKHRYYFADSIGLEEGRIYMSVLDLNVENMKIVIPYKPVIRFATPVFSKEGMKVGIIFFNYMVDGLLNDLHFDNVLNESFFYLINRDGYYLVNSENPEMEFGFMFPDGEENRAQVYQPEIWDVAVEDDSGHFILDNDLYVFTKVYPLKDNWISGCGNSTLSGKSETIIHPDEYCWYLATKIPENIVKDELKKVTASLRPLFLGVLVTIIFLSFLLAFFKTKVRQKAEMIRQMALVDTLTGLFNRKFGIEMIDIALKRSGRKNTKAAVLFSDLDKFKNVNDTFGHEAGDEVLKVAARRIIQEVRPSDVVIRLGGDEFIILLDDVEDFSIIDKVARRILTSIPDPIPYKTHSLTVSASIGIAVFPEDGTLPEPLVSKADTAMYKAKQEGKGIFFYRDLENK